MTNLNLFPVHVYGLTETYGPITKGYHMPVWETLPIKEKYARMARQGHGFITGLPIQIIKPDQPEGVLIDVAKDGKEIGEIIFFGNICAKEYLKDAEATRKLFAGGGLHSGDLAVWHEDGSAQILDRAKDIIISGGENISSVALEAMLVQHPDVLEAGVVAVDDSHWGERPKAFITVQAGKSLKGEDLITWAKHESAISKFMVPREVEIVEELPKTSTGKVSNWAPLNLLAETFVLSISNHISSALKMPFTRYASAHQNPQGPGDNRPTAQQIIQDEGLEGKLRSKTILITGCSSGIGIETARSLSSTGCALFLTARNIPEAESALEGILEPGRVELLEMDMESLGSVRKGTTEFRTRNEKLGGRLNVLICNAGVMAIPTQEKTKDGFEMQLGVNHLSHFLLFNLLKDIMLESSTDKFQSRVVMVASSGHSGSGILAGNYGFKKEEYGAGKAYGQSKTANIYMANEIERRYDEAQKNWWQWKGVKSTEQGAATTVLAAVGKEWEGVGGKYLEDCQDAPMFVEGGEPSDPGYSSWAFNEVLEKRLHNPPASHAPSTHYLQYEILRNASWPTRRRPPRKKSTLRSSKHLRHETWTRKTNRTHSPSLKTPSQDKTRVLILKSLMQSLTILLHIPRALIPKTLMETPMILLPLPQVPVAAVLVPPPSPSPKGNPLLNSEDSLLKKKKPLKGNGKGQETTSLKKIKGFGKRRKERLKREKMKGGDERQEYRKTAREGFKENPTSTSDQPFSAQENKRIRDWEKECEEFFKETPGSEFLLPPKARRAYVERKCIKGDKLKVCHHDLERTLMETAGNGYGVAWLKQERLRWHPDKFSGDKFPAGTQDRAQEMFQLV
ncbi:hypothetical protein G7Y89_g14742 [Cudoniella acicularis]|uniref:AMP-binding enzyme C-terminal domain-containing protein n=1 Tax=Cudoniella acicularis TaxID=354080 RepID=A0A8H4VQG2_9HELO|nr:hypothetical protein G7Y89_g14742 [Cudoniella acicularis]